MIINKDVISKLHPCKDRFDNYVKYYKNKNFTPQQFMRLKNITHRDKIWVALRLVDKKQLRFIAADIAESVLHIFGSKYPNDNGPRKAIEAARSNNPLKDNTAPYGSSIIHAAAVAEDASWNSDVAYAVIAAAQVAYSISPFSVHYDIYHDGDFYSHNSFYAILCAMDAILSCHISANDKLKQEKLNSTIILKYLLKEKK